MSDDTYNGWANRETWALCLHLGNDQSTYEWAKVEAQRAIDDYTESMIEFGYEVKSPVPAARVGRHIIEQVTETLPDLMVPDAYAMMREDVGSVWRVDESEVGKWALELIAEDDDQ